MTHTINPANTSGPFFAPAKVNLTLSITGRRGDGYHLLHSLVAFTQLSDVMWVAPADTMTLQVDGPYAKDVPRGTENLVWRAAQAVLAACGKGELLSIRLIKNLPVAAGLGGGSADAACVLRVLPSILGAELADSTRTEIATKLGADVAVCIGSQPCVMTGVGEKLGPPLKIPPMPILLVNPGVLVSTPDVFQAYRDLAAPFSTPSGNLASMGTTADLLAALHAGGNDLTTAATKVCPEISNVLHILSQQAGCGLVRMTGSGATCFGLFEDAALAGQAARRIQQQHPGWWVVDTLLADSGIPA